MSRHGQEARIAVPAWYGTNPVTLSLSPEFHLRRQRVISSYVGGMSAGPTWTHERLMRAGDRARRRAPLESVVTHRVPFSDAPDGYASSTTRRPTRWASILEYGNERR